MDSMVYDLFSQDQPFHQKQQTQCLLNFVFKSHCVNGSASREDPALSVRFRLYLCAYTRTLGSEFVSTDRL